MFSITSCVEYTTAAFVVVFIVVYIYTGITIIIEEDSRVTSIID